MLKLLSWIRSYYLFFYYTSALDTVNGEQTPTRGFIYTAGLVMLFPALLLLGIANYIYPFMSDGMQETLFIFRGSVNQLMLLYAAIDIALTYFVCCFRIPFRDIAPRLQQIPFFAQRSIPKCLLLALINFLIMIFSMILLYT